MYSSSQEQWTNSWRLAAAAMRLPSLLTLAGAWASSLCGCEAPPPASGTHSAPRSPTFHQLNSVWISLSFLGHPVTVYVSPLAGKPPSLSFLFQFCSKTLLRQMSAKSVLQAEAWALEKLWPGFMRSLIQVQGSTPGTLKKKERKYVFKP